MKLIVCLRQGPSYTFLSPIPHTLYRAFAFRPQSNGFVNFQVKGKKKTGPEEVELFLGPIPHGLVPSKGAGSADVYILESNLKIKPALLLIHLP